MRILVIEDDASLQRLLRRGLSEEGFGVDVAADGECALDLARTGTLRRDRPRPDDPEDLGDRGPADAARERRGTPILILTARDASEDKIAGLDGGADDYLTKPFVFAELVARIRALVAAGARRRALGDPRSATSSSTPTPGARSAAAAPSRCARRSTSCSSSSRCARGKLVTRAQIHDRLFGKDSETLGGTRRGPREPAAQRGRPAGSRSRSSTRSAARATGWRSG